MASEEDLEVFCFGKCEESEKAGTLGLGLGTLPEEKSACLALRDVELLVSCLVMQVKGTLVVMVNLEREIYERAVRSLDKNYI